MRRGMPLRPRMWCGPNVRLKPISISQKCTLPRRSLIIFPKIFGNQ